MDAIKILGSILKSQMSSSGRGNNDLLGSVLGSVLGGSSNKSGGGGLGDILGSLAGQMGGNQQSQKSGGQAGQESGGGGLLGGLLGSLMGNKSSSKSGGQVDSQSSGNPLDAILGGLKQGDAKSMGSQGTKDLGKLVMGALGGLASGQDKEQGQNFEVSQFDTNEAQDQATILIRSMANAAKSDGEIDKQEQEKILGQLGDEVSESEMNFIKQELQRPLDVQEFVSSVPNNMQQQVYAMSLMTIKLDNQNEANYLNQLAQGFNMKPQEVNQLHEKMNAPKLYS